MRFIFALLVLILVTLPVHAACDPTEQAIRLGVTSRMDPPPRQRAVLDLGVAINGQFNGTACLQVLEDSQTYRAESAFSLLQSGGLELAALSYSELSQLAPAYGVFDLPFAFRDTAGMNRFRKLAAKPLLAALRPYDISVLETWDGSFVQIAAKHAIYKPEELADLATLPGGGPNARQILSILDATIPKISEEDRGLAIFERRIEAQFIDWEQLQYEQSARLFGSITQSNHSYAGYLLLASKAWWEKLDPIFQTELRSLIRRTTLQSNRESILRLMEARRSIVASGVPVRALTLNQRREWRVRLDSIWEDFENQELIRLVEQADRAP